MTYIPSLVVNVNDSVWVRLTDEGRYFHQKHYDDLIAPILRYSVSHPDYEAPEEIQGFSRFQLWSLLEIFGQHIHSVPFLDNAIYLVKPY